MNWDNFSCVDMARKIKDEISAKLNAMTPEERHLYFEHINHEAKQEFEAHKSKREKFYEHG